MKWTNAIKDASKHIKEGAKTVVAKTKTAKKTAKKRVSHAKKSVHHLKKAFGIGNLNDKIIQDLARINNEIESIDISIENLRIAMRERPNKYSDSISKKFIKLYLQKRKDYQKMLNKLKKELK